MVVCLSVDTQFVRSISGRLKWLFSGNLMPRFRGTDTARKEIEVHENLLNEDSKNSLHKLHALAFFVCKNSFDFTGSGQI